ncbi:MAG: hypothetical protein JWP83_5726 [Mycobacterium sp.]|nr:hypothetical protein [Mycobacterium sp.]
MRLRKNGTTRVRMAKMISVCVASDSTNRPVRNSMASGTPSINPTLATRWAPAKPPQP